MRECGKVFEELGAQVSSIEFPEAREALQVNPGGMIIATEGYSLNKELVDKRFDDLDPIVAHRMIKGKDVTADEYAQTCYHLIGIRAKAGNVLNNIDLLLAPTTPLPAKPVAEIDSSLENYFEKNAFYLRNTCIGNVLNLCGLSIPCGFTKDGLPIGLMIYGKPFQEDVVLRAGYAFQQATDWHRRVPDLSWLANK